MNNKNSLGLWSITWEKDTIIFWVWNFDEENGKTMYTFPQKIECVLVQMSPWKEGKMSFIINPLQDGDENMKPNHIIFDLATSTIDSTEKMSVNRSLCAGAPIVDAKNN